MGYRDEAATSEYLAERRPRAFGAHTNRGCRRVLGDGQTGECGNVAHRAHVICTPRRPVWRTPEGGGFQTLARRPYGRVAQHGDRICRLSRRQCVEKTDKK